MTARPCPATRDPMAGASRAFDSVCTPVDTQLLSDAAPGGLRVISGKQLFFHQGLHAVAIFHGHETDEEALRQAFAEDAPGGPPVGGG